MNRGQIKVQEMAFVLVAFVVFFALAGLFFLAIRMNELSKNVGEIKDDKTKEELYRLSGTPELSWSACSGCIDLDKVQVLRNKGNIETWDFDYLAFERVYPPRVGGECNSQNYPLCNKTTLVQGKDYGVAVVTYVSLCQWDAETGTEKCSLGKVYASARSVRK